ncbi:hypothetical protein Dda_6563 [Drechslerella dactyloides]|uniref:BTB domain-containing protein n=1 Tax=Drechslerella dactyloides TaxID=74499 RepID=A0AAD6NHI3_DREDA|nr:hypothetical protein Dda_6563 [Drechslerella dactyloides]
MSKQPTPCSQVSALLNSETISIKVGAAGEILHVHRHLFENSESPSLKAIVSGKYKEGKGENGLDWSDEDVETIKRMLAFLYTGDYHVPEPRSVNSAANTKKAANNTEDKPDPYGGSNSTDSIDDEGDAPGLMRPLTPIQYHLKDVRLPTWRVTTEAGKAEYMNRGHRTSEYAHVLLAHAQVYVLADYHQVKSLMKMALQRLTQVMLHMVDGAADLQSDLLQLVNYTYHQQILRPENLRKLVAQFAALHFQELSGEGWEDILEQGGLFVKDLCARLSRRILNQEVKMGGARGRIAQRHAKQRNGVTSHLAHANIPPAVNQWYTGNLDSAEAVAALLQATNAT